MRGGGGGRGGAGRVSMPDAAAQKAANAGAPKIPDLLPRIWSLFGPYKTPLAITIVLVLVGAALRLRGHPDVGMLILAGLFTLITAPVVANRVGQLAYREQSFRDDLLTKDDMAERTED